jgi:hypothetical protein
VDEELHQAWGTDPRDGGPRPGWRPRDALPYNRFAGRHKPLLFSD